MNVTIMDADDWAKAKEEERIMKKVQDRQSQRKVPYLSFFDNKFDIDSQLPIDDLIYHDDGKKDFNYESINTRNIYEKKKEIVAFLKFKFSDPSSRGEVYKELISIFKMRNRLLARKKPFTAPLSIENKIVTTDFCFIRSLLKIEFFKYKKGIPHSYLYADVDAFVYTLCKFLMGRPYNAEFDFNGTYTELFNENIGKNVEDERQRKLDEMNAKQLKDFPISKPINFYDIYNEAVDFDRKALVLNLKFFRQCFKNLPHGETDNLMETFEFPLILFDVNEIEYRRIAVAFSGRHSLVEDCLDKIDDKESITLVMSSKFDEYNDHLIYKTMFNGHRVPVNMGLVYYMIYRIAQTSVSGFFKEYKDELRKYTVRRILMTKCRIAFSTSKFYPQLMVPLVNAVYYSFFISKKMFENDRIYFYQERMRELYPYGKCFYNILDMYSTEKKAKLYLEKHIRNRAGWLSRRGAQLVDEEIKRMIRESFKCDNHGYMIRHFDKTYDRPINMIRNAFEKTIDLNNYIHSYYSYRFEVGNEIIDKYTMRPRVVIGKGPNDYVTTYYSRLMLAHNSYLNEFGNFVHDTKKFMRFDINKLISLYKPFQNYVMKHKKFPDINHYHLYVDEKYNRRADGKICFFHPSISLDINNVHKNYMKFINENKITVSMFIDALKRSETLYDRIRIEDNGIEGKKNIEDNIKLMKARSLYLNYNRFSIEP